MARAVRVSPCIRLEAIYVNIHGWVAKYNVLCCHLQLYHPNRRALINPHPSPNSLDTVVASELLQLRAPGVDRERPTAPAPAVRSTTSPATSAGRWARTPLPGVDGRDRRDAERYLGRRGGPSAARGRHEEDDRTLPSSALGRRGFDSVETPTSRRHPPRLPWRGVPGTSRGSAYAGPPPDRTNNSPQRTSTPDMTCNAHDTHSRTGDGTSIQEEEELLQATHDVLETQTGQLQLALVPFTNQAIADAISKVARVPSSFAKSVSKNTANPRRRAGRRGNVDVHNVDKPGIDRGSHDGLHPTRQEVRRHGLPARDACVQSPRHRRNSV